MAFDTSMSTQTAQTSALDTQAATLLKRVQSAVRTGTDTSKEDAKITKAGTDFESILIGSWLQQAESTFATVPGGDEEEDPGSGKDQFQGIAMQALAGSITKSGGIGIAKMISQHLHAASGKSDVPVPAKAGATGSVTPDPS